MGEFYAWALTGQIAKLQVWSAPGEADATHRPDEAVSLRIANKLVQQQKFMLRARSGPEVQLHLRDSGLTLSDGHVITAAWAARQGAQHGHCVFIKNHTTGNAARLENNIGHLRSQVSRGKIASYGIVATLPAALALFAWLFIPGNLANVDPIMFLIGMTVALIVLFAVGTIVAKVVFDYLRSEDDDRIWTAVTRAITREAEQQVERRTFPHLAYRA